MSARYILAALVLLAVPAAADECRLTQVSSLATTPDADGGITVPASIDGHDLRLLVDTAGIYNLLTETTVDTMQLQRRQMRRSLRLGGSDEVLSSSVSSKNFKLGNIVSDRMDFVVIPDHTLVEGGAQGTLGPAFLAAYDVEIDPAHAKLNFFAPDHCPGQAVYWTSTAYAELAFRVDKTLHIIVPVTLDGQVMEAQVDTGSTVSWINLDTAQSAFGWGSDVAPAPGPGDSQKWYRYPFKSLSLNGIDVKNPKILIARHASHKGLVIGMDVLSKLHVFISYSENKMYFTGADAPPPEPAAKP
jgi:predicted aspartyl protease